jgi:hypothetical protein
MWQRTPSLGTVVVVDGDRFDVFADPDDIFEAEFADVPVAQSTALTRQSPRDTERAAVGHGNIPSVAWG